MLTAGHNLDLDNDGLPDAGLAVNFHMPGVGVFAASAFYTCPGFTGFGNPSIQRDLGLLYFAAPLPMILTFPALGYSLQLGDKVVLVGFGHSGYGNYGYTTSASLTDRRVGFNVVDSFTPDDRGGGVAARFQYYFDSPETFGQLGGSLGNNLETLIAAGDSGGPLLIDFGSGYAIAGVNTFTQGYGGRFGEIGGGVVLAPYWDWICEKTGIAIPEPCAGGLLLFWLAILVLRLRFPNPRPSSGRQRPERT